MARSALKTTKLSFWLLMIAAQVGGFFLFKDLADISQWLVQSSREFTMFIWYNRWLIAISTLVALFGSILIWFNNRNIVPRGLLIALVLFCLFNWYSGMLNTLLMFRPQQFEGQAMFVSVDEAPKFLQQMKHAAYEKPEFDSVDEIEMLVLENDNGARAYADYYLLQPHIVDGGEIGGKPVVMTYCGLTNMGIAYTPELKGQPLELKVMTQLVSTVSPASSTTVARTSPASWPLSSSAEPVPVDSDGASSESTIAAAAPGVSCVWTASAAPPAVCRPTAVRLPGAYRTVLNSANPNSAQSAAPRLWPFKMSSTTGRSENTTMLSSVALLHGGLFQAWETRTMWVAGSGGRPGSSNATDASHCARYLQCQK